MGRARLGDQAGGRGDGVLVGLHAVERPRPQRGLAGRRGHTGATLFLALCQQFHRDEEHRGARAAAGGRGEGHVDVVLDAARARHAAYPLGHALEQLQLVQLLERVAVARAGAHVLHQRHDGHGGRQAFREARHQQRRRGPVLRRDHGHAARDARVGVGHVGAGVLLAVADLPDADVVAGQCQRRRIALAEQEFDAVPAQGAREALRRAQRRVGVVHGEVSFRGAGHAGGSGAGPMSFVEEGKGGATRYGVISTLQWSFGWPSSSNIAGASSSDTVAVTRPSTAMRPAAIMRCTNGKSSAV